MVTEKPVLILICGINGAGKTTFYYEQVKPLLDRSGRGYPFVNADEMEEAKFPNEIGKHSLEMAKLAAQIRGQYIKVGQSFITETVFSHESKGQLVKDAQKARFEVILNHIHVSSAELAYKRILDRVGSGGHDVPKEKIFSRYDRTVDNIQKASRIADRTYVWDNSRQSGHSGVIYRFVMTMAKGKITRLTNPIPDWACRMYRSQIEKFNKKR
ncbi:MAG: zeta toxin family protein [Gammaproteobacteria bacterium]|nr:zeta toxin family protein [Gammaproteobacteria bacterium]MDE0302593.1 zeta toxin family protein [Gammaproteobacteria bacterium]